MAASLTTPICRLAPLHRLCRPPKTPTDRRCRSRLPGIGHKVRTRARRLKRRHGLDLIVIDYLQLLRPAREDRIQGSQREQNRVQEVSEITHGLKGLAKELDLPVLALSQLNRSVEQRDDKRPLLSDLRESGSIEQALAGDRLPTLPLHVIARNA